MKTARFTRMEDGTQAEFEHIDALELKRAEGTADRLLRALADIADEPTGYAVNRLTHSLQSATRAERDGEDAEYVICALLHDLGDDLAPHNHASFAAEILKPFVTWERWWMVKHHGVFQGHYFWHHLGEDRNARDVHAGHPCYEATARFCERHDQNCFDPDYDTLPLEHFAPALRSIFARDPWSRWSPPEGAIR